MKKMAYDSLLMCKKCHSNLVIPKRITVKKLTVFVWARCSHCKKEVRFTLPLPQIHEWVDAIAGNFFRCPKCGVPGVVTRSITSGDFTKLRLHCSSCQKGFIKVATSSIYSYLMASNYNQMKPQATQPAYFVPMQQGSQAPSAPPAAPLPPTPPAPPVVAPPASPSPVAMKRCTNCNGPLTPSASFCRKCGVPVEQGADKAPRCPFCGATLSEKAKVCPKCSSEVRCQKCDALFYANARFCIKCGEPMSGKVEEVEAPKIACHFCGAALELNDKVCPECGKPVVCPNCGNHLKSGVRFCNKCGTNVSEITLTSPEAGYDEDLEDEDEEESEPPAKMIVCPDCGAQMSEIYTFCTICGTKLDKE